MQSLKEKRKAEVVGLQVRKPHHLPATNGHHLLGASWELHPFWTTASHECPGPRVCADLRELCRQAPEFAFHWKWEKTASAPIQEAQQAEGNLAGHLCTRLAWRRNELCSQGYWMAGKELRVVYSCLWADTIFSHDSTIDASSSWGHPWQLWGAAEASLGMQPTQALQAGSSYSLLHLPSCLVSSHQLAPNWLLHGSPLSCQGCLLAILEHPDLRESGGSHQGSYEDLLASWTQPTSPWSDISKDQFLFRLLFYCFSR